MRQGFLLLAVLATLGLAACGDDEEAVPEEVDAATFVGCMEDSGLGVRDGGDPGSLASSPEAAFTISSGGDDHVFAYVFDGAGKAEAAAETADDSEVLTADYEGTVLWTNGPLGRITKDVEDALRACASA